MPALDPTRTASLLLLSATLLLTLTHTPAAAEPSLDGASTTVTARLDTGLRTVGFTPSAAEEAPAVPVRVVDLAATASPATAIDFALETEQRIRLEILDLDGELVRTVAQGLWAQGRHRLAWQHDNEDGELLEEGRYVVRLVPENEDTRMALAR